MSNRAILNQINNRINNNLLLTESIEKRWQKTSQIRISD